MKKFQKLMSLLLTGAMLMTLLAGCSGSGDAGNASAGDTNNASTDDAGSTDNADASDAGNGEGTAAFKIGAIGPATGDAAVYGIAVQNGADLAIKEINAAGGINGIMLEYNFQDDECDNEKSVNAYNALKDWGMQMLVGTTTSG